MGDGTRLRSEFGRSLCGDTIEPQANKHYRPPLSARFARLTDSIYNFIGLYIVSLFSLDPYSAAQNSQFNVIGRPNTYQERLRWGGVNRTGNGGWGGGGGWGSGSDRRGPGGGGGPSRRLGTVDDVRGPECGSCR